MKNIKDEYKKGLNVFIGLHLFIMYVLIFGFNIDELKQLSGEDIYKSIFILILPLISLILNGLLPNYIKEFIVFWKFTNRLPGHKAFSKYAKKDSRIDFQNLKDKYSEIESEKLDENRLWYKIYKQYVESPSVWDSQKNYLFMRDITNLTIIFMIIILIINYFFDVNYIYYIGLGIEYILLMIVCRNYAIKFVTNVLAEDSVK